MTLQRILIPVITLAVFTAGAGRAGESTPAPKAGDDDTCRFFLPGKFTDAMAKAAETNRCLLIKGVAVGMDRVGAACSTRGHW